MLQFFAKYKFFGLVLLILSALIITIMYRALKPKDRLQIIEPVSVAEELVDPSMQFVKKYHGIPDFKLLNQNGDTITQADYEDKIYVADFFFTTCATICPIMTDHMVQIQEALGGDPMVKLLSHSVTPEIDSVPQLKKYALEKGVNDSVWNLVTGDREQIYNLARKAYFAAKKDAVGEYGMIHTENFVLIDKEKRLRGYYDGTDPEDIEQLLEDIEILKSEY
ncbi:SCO family protein [Gilvibacter sediminis]|uniref:SCO family protein n=1 Tax=Gilvibacter sediminis TaxID=379071 RepID=UPI00234FEBBB|nr:SCO family protein [Gilvibacter sediminis]MDC7996694.1 SCO family protein [Gilvibacter sediminis]